VGLFLDAAYRILREENRPLTAREITEFALTRGYLATSGRTPWQTMKSKLSTEILQRGDESLFMRSEKATFALREWKKRLHEHVADRYQKALFDEDIVVFPRAVLLETVPGVGLHTGVSSMSKLAVHFYPMRRRIAEEDFSVVQLVSVFILRYEGKILTYKRAKRLPEARLHGYYSIAFGGHLNPSDLSPLFDILVPEQGYPWLERELREEVKLPHRSISAFRYTGLLYDDSRAVSSQHLGIVYLIDLNSSAYEIGERGFLIDPKFETLAEIRSRLDDFENWSVLLLRHLESAHDS
jgi:predicted NUDIX family phosphoesterase